MSFKSCISLKQFIYFLNDKNLFYKTVNRTKKLTVHPGQHLSLQYHEKRSKHWAIIVGKENVNFENKNVILEKDESIDIPLVAKQSLGHDTKENLIIIEVLLGTYFGKNDIIRISVPYNR